MTRFSENYVIRLNNVMMSLLALRTVPCNNMKMLSNSISKVSYWLPLIAIPIIFWNCYWYVGFNDSITKLLKLILALLLIIIYHKDLVNVRQGLFERDVLLIFISFFISTITALIYWKQNPILSFRAGVTTLIIMYYFTLKRRNVDSKRIELLCILFSIVYALLWLFALSQAPNVVFGNQEEIDDNRGFYRILQLNSIDLVALLYCISLEKIFSAKNKIVWIALGAAAFVLIFLSLTRILIAGLFAITLVFLLRKKSVIIIIFAALLGFCGGDLLLKNPVFTEMVNMTTAQIDDSEGNSLRLPEYSGVFKLYPSHIGTILFGNGDPHINSSYGKYEDNLKNQYFFNRSDAGYVGLYSSYGLFLLFVMIRLLIRVIKYKAPPGYLPYKLFILFMFIVNITSYTFWTFGVSFMISLYMLDRSRFAQ